MIKTNISTLYIVFYTHISVNWNGSGCKYKVYLCLNREKCNRIRNKGLDRRSHLSCHFWVIEFDASRWRLVRLARHQPEIMSRPSSNNRYNSTWQSTQQWTFARCKNMCKNIVQHLLYK